ncbi:MAG: hypothetical protein GY759_01015 [Chloroflexi bacterium]|nr:hypothetical protein [Chloroflexota bacterium]
MSYLDLGSSSQAWFLAPTPRIALDAPIVGDGPVVGDGPFLDDLQGVSGWLPARVPGCVQRDLMRVGQLPDLYKSPDPYEASHWIHDNDWWYRTELPAIPADQRAWLRFDGIDYQGAVVLNGVELGRGAGMYARRQWEVTEALRQGKGDLAVRIWGAGALPKWPDSVALRLKRQVMSRLQGGIPAFDDRLLTLKAPLHFGWDFAPRLLPIGIWDDVALHCARDVGIVDVWARAEWEPEHGVIVQLAVDANCEKSIHITLKMTGVKNNLECLPLRKTIEVRSGRQIIHLHWKQALLQPWTTHDRGVPQRYRLSIQLEDERGILDEHETMVGCRTIAWEQPSSSRDSARQLFLNGERLRLRGVNWVPLDLLPGAEEEVVRYRRLLQAAVDAGVNALRVWGGGGRERKCFYDLCDELGLLVWQELPIACVFLDRMSQERAFLDLARQEASGIVRSLRGHPSLMLWGGGNEWGPGRHKKLAAVLGEVVAHEDPSRRWLPASPGPHDSHNWQVWHDKAPPDHYSKDPSPLLSEFGLAAPPHAETMAKLLPPETLWPPTDTWLERHAEPDKLCHYAQALGSLDLHQTSSPSEARAALESFVLASQNAQARGLQAGIEAYRLRENAIGAFIWQWNEPWPAICWSIIPYSGPPKRAYEQIRRSYSPIAPLARLTADGVELWIVNDLPTSPGACEMIARVDGEVVWEGKVTPPANDRELVYVLPSTDSSAQCLALELKGPGVEQFNDYALNLVWPAVPTSRRPLLWLRSLVKRWALRW